MSINLIAQQAFSAGILIADSYNSVNGSINNTGQLTQVNGKNVCAALEIRSIEGALLIPRLDNAQVAALPSKGPLADGMMIYNTDDLAFQLRIDGGWVNFAAGAGGGDVTGPGVSIIDNIATWGNETGTLLKDSGVAITQVPAPVGVFIAADVNMLTEVGLIEFTNSRGGLFLTASAAPDADAYLAQNMFLNTSGGLTQACTVFNGTQTGGATSSTNALVELNSTTGVLLLSRLTNAEISALATPINGMITYNEDANTFSAYQNGGWVNLGAGGSGTVTSIAAGPFLSTGGGPITAAGTISVSNSTANTLLGFDNGGVPANVTANSFVSIASNHIGLVATSTHSTLLGFRSTDGVTSNITLGANLSMSGTVLNAASGNVGTVTSVATDNIFLTGGPISTTGTISVISDTDYANKLLGWLGNGMPTVVSAGSGIVIVDGVISVEAGGAGTVTSVATGTGLTGGPITTTGTISIANTTITPRSYSFPVVTFNAQGQATSAISYGTITTGYGAIVIGNQAGGLNPSNSYSMTGFGDRVFSSISLPGSSNNSAFGASALTNLTGTGSNDNTGIGFEALVFSAEGASNTALGSSSGATYATYNGCTFLGAGADTSANSLSNATAVGYLAIAGASNTLVLGHNSKVGIGISSPVYTLDLANVATTTPQSCAVRFAATTNEPTTPTDINGLLLFNNAGALSTKDHFGVITPLGSGTVTQINTSGFITGGPITTTGTISLGNSTAGTLLGFNPSGGAPVNITLGTNLSLSGTTLNATGGGGGSVSITAVANRGITLSPSTITGTGTVAVTEMAIVGAGTGAESLFWGFESGGTGTSVAVPQCIGIGGLSLNLLSTFASGIRGNRNIGIGAQSLANMRFISDYPTFTYANDNVGIGYKSLGNLMLLVGGSLTDNDINSNTAIGNDCLSKLMQFATYPAGATKYALGNTACGHIAGNILNAGFSNSFFGYQAGIVSGDSTIYAQNCTIIGALTTLGFNPGVDEVLADSVTIIGANSLVNSKSSSAIGANITINSQFSTCLGAESVVQASSDGGTALGAKSQVTSGNAAGTAIGFQSLVNWHNSTALGANVSTGAANTCVLGSNQFVGINNSTPEYALDIAPVAPGGIGTAIAAIQLQSSALPATPASGNVVIYNNSGVFNYLLPSGDHQTVLGISSAFMPGNYGFADIAISSEGVVTSITSAGIFDTTGNNIFIGVDAGASVQLGATLNYGFGYQALMNLTYGGNNCAYGALALSSATVANNNCAMGTAALQLADLGGGNVAIGGSAGSLQVMYASCNFIGSAADASANGLTNATAIGYFSRVGADNSMVLGGTGGNQVNVGIGTETPKAMLHVAGGQIVNLTLTATDYTVLVTDYIIGITNTSAPRSVLLPTPSSDNAGQIFIVKDQSGGAYTNNISITANGGANIDGTPIAQLNVNYASMSFYSNGTTYNIF